MVRFISSPPVPEQSEAEYIEARDRVYSDGLDEFDEAEEEERDDIMNVGSALREAELRHEEFKERFAGGSRRMGGPDADCWEVSHMPLLEPSILGSFLNNRYFWRQADGEWRLLENLTASHRQNILNLLVRVAARLRAKYAWNQSLWAIGVGGGYGPPDDILTDEWMDEVGDKADAVYAEMLADKANAIDWLNACPLVRRLKELNDAEEEPDGSPF